MKKLTSIILTFAFSLSTLAGEITGKILNLRSDEEGMKVIVQAQDESITVAYLSNQSADFLNTVKTLQAAKSIDAKIKIITKDNALAEVIAVKVLN
jgi:hypothetical protein